MHDYAKIYENLINLNNSKQEDQNLFLFFLREISNDTKWLSDIETIEFIKELNALSNKVKSNLGSFLVGRLLFKSLNQLHGDVLLKLFEYCNLGESKSLCVIDLELTFYSRTGLWKSLGFFQASLIHCGIDFFLKTFHYFSFICEANTNPVFLANLSDTMAQYLIHDQKISFTFIEGFIVKCGYFSNDYLLVHLKSLFLALSKTDHSNSLECLCEQMVNLGFNYSTLSHKFKKFILIELGRHAEAQNSGKQIILTNKKERILDQFLVILFETSPDKRQFIIKELRKNIRGDHCEIPKLFFLLVTKYSSYSLQYMLVNIICMFKNASQEGILKLLELLKHSSFAEIRKLCLNHLSFTRSYKPPSDLHLFLEVFLANSRYLSPSELEGHVNLALLQIELYKYQFFIDELMPILLIHALELHSKVLLDIPIIVEGIFLGFLLLLNRIFSNFSHEEIAILDPITLRKLSEVMRGTFDLISFVIEDEAPEGEEFDEHFQLYTDNKSRKICHYSWRIAREISWLLLHISEFMRDREEIQINLNFLQQKLLSCRHKGAICGLVEPFSGLLSLFFESSNLDDITNLSKSLIMNSLNSPLISSTRRSAGIPYLICEVFKRLPEHLSEEIFSFLFSLQIDDSNESSYIHFLNALRMLCKDSEVSERLLIFHGKILNICLKFIVNDSWNLVNTSSLLISSLFQLILSEYTIKRKNTIIDADAMLAFHSHFMCEITGINHLSKRIIFPLLIFFRGFSFNPTSPSQEKLISLVQKLLDISVLNRNYFCRKIASEIIQNNSFFRRNVRLNATNCVEMTNSKYSGYQNLLKYPSLLESLEPDSRFLKQFHLLEKFLKFHFSAYQVVHYFYDKYLQVFAPLPFRQLVSGYFGEWLISNNPASNLQILMYARFCLVDDDGDIREKFLSYWRAYKSAPDYGFICALKSIYTELSALPEFEQQKFIDLVIIKRLRKIVETFQLEINYKKLFSFEPFNYFENLELEFIIMKELGIQFTIPLDISEYYELNKDKFAEGNVFSNYYRVFALQ